MAESHRRVSRGGQESSVVQQNGNGGRGRMDRGGDMGDEDEVGSHQGGLSGVQDEDDDPARRRFIRHQYRELINSVQQNREDMLSPSNNKLTEVLEEANKLFANVRQAREAALDAQFLVLATDLGKEKASQLQADGSAFDPTAYAEHLLTFMGLNRLEDEDSDGEGPSGGYLPQDAWQRLGNKVGLLLAEPPAPRQRVERQRKAPSKDVKRIMPTQLKKMEESHQEATEKEVERILAYLQQYHEDDRWPSKDLSGKDKLPYIAPIDKGEAETAGASSRQQCVISLSPASWKEIIEAFDIKEAMITPSVASTPAE